MTPLTARPAAAAALLTPAPAAAAASPRTDPS